LRSSTVYGDLTYKEISGSRYPIPRRGFIAMAEKPTLVAAVQQLAREWRRRLTSLDRRNPTLFFRALKTGTLRLPDLDGPSMVALVDAGKALDLNEALQPGPELSRRVDAIRAKAKENEEERGIQTMFLAIGMATWKAPDGGKDPQAPVFLLPVTITEPAKRIHINRGGDLLINRVMLQFWSEEHKHKPHTFDADEPIETKILDALHQVELAGRSLDGFSVSTECYLGNFSFAKMAMVEDLRRNEALLALNRLICAIAGDRDAQQAIRESAGSIECCELDMIDPTDEAIVLEADEYQRQAIHSLTRFESDGIIDGPPGTGKSQTIANLIAALVADGKRVLFVAEKRAALDAVFKRLAQAGLDDFVLDLHGAEARRKNVYERLRQRDEMARLLEDKHPATSAKRLASLRGDLNAYFKAVNAPLERCRLSVRDIIYRLSKIPHRASTLWYDDQLDNMTEERHQEARRACQVLAQDPHLFRRVSGVPWSHADFAEPSVATAAIRKVGETRIDLLRLRSELEPIVRTTVSDATTMADVASICRAIRALAAVKTTFNDDIVTADAVSLHLALKPARSSALKHSFSYIFSGAYRAALSTLRAHAKDRRTNRTALAARIEDCATLPNGYLSTTVLNTVNDKFAGEVATLWNRIQARLSEIAEASGETLPADVAETLDLITNLASAERSARRIPAIRKAQNDLQTLGYGTLVEELQRTTVSSEYWTEMADSAWLRSFLEKAKTDEPLLGGFSRDSFERARKEFQDLDARQITAARTIVRRAAAEAYIQALNSTSDQALIFKGEIQKKSRAMPIRRLVERTGDVMTALCPCFMASPLSVSQLLPGKVIFDVVIFDEASQVMPEDAITCIMRGQRTVVAGDQKQLPPTAFFASGSPERDDEEYKDDSELNQVDLAGMESILDAMKTYCSPNSLNVHYRSLDESLIRFSNHEFYHDRLITFPGAGILDGGLSHVSIEAPYVDGEELSSSAEIRKVADLVIEHAEQRPDETLGVIALGIKHARRLEAEILKRCKQRPDLDDFFANDEIDKAFFVKNLERVQGDERDAIILSFGYAQDAVGKLKNKLGPLNYEGGQRRLNVAVTRSKNRMIVTSTFSEHDMDPKSFSSAGAQTLSRYLAFARSGGKRLDEMKAEDELPNDFERDVMETLQGKGLTIVPQLGVTKYRIDLAVVHPRYPNRYVLAIECDGAPYHSSATARDRDRLRQRHLESRGWRFHRIWSLDWHDDRVGEIERAVEAYSAAVNDMYGPITTTVVAPDQREAETNNPAPKQRLNRPRIHNYERIGDFRESDIQAMLDWIASDGVLRSDDEMLVEVVPALGFSRRGRLIDERLNSSIKRWRNRTKDR
jgi:very-short-patch-repair endonuclease